MRYALIGEKLKHSYSAEIHKEKGLDYALLELEKEKLEKFVKEKEFNGFNVTIPYKKDIIPFLDEVSKTAEKIGAVNTVLNKNGKLIGYNTDLFGLEFAFKDANINVKDKVVLILGTGGASNTAYVYAKENGAKKVIKVSRTGTVNYENVYSIDAEIIINTTPVGMFPENLKTPILLDKFKNLKGVVDLIYNPLKTKLLLDAEALGVKCANGLLMLVAQAIKAQELWLDKKFTENDIYIAYDKIKRSKQNLVLFGMPSCGKSTLGKIIANLSGKELVDIDEYIKNKIGKTPSQIILESGEKAFRDIETEVCLEVSKKSGKIISAGGGSVLREQNRNALKQNAICVYIERDLDKLITDNRPLSQQKGVKELYEERKEIYNSFADITIQNNGDVNKAVEVLKRLL